MEKLGLLFIVHSTATVLQFSHCFLCMACLLAFSLSICGLLQVFMLQRFHVCLFGQIEDSVLSADLLRFWCLL